FATPRSSSAHPLTAIAPTSPVAKSAGVSTLPNGGDVLDEPTSTVRTTPTATESAPEGTVMVAVWLGDPPRTFDGLIMLTVNCPLPFAEAFVRPTHSLSAVAVHDCAAFPTLTLTPCDGVTRVIAPLSPSFVAAKRNGLDGSPRSTDSVGQAPVVNTD